MARTRIVAVGAFVIAGILLFAVGIFLIGDRRMLFDDTFEAYAEFSNIAGLQNGAKVRVGGMDAGEVQEIKVPGSPSGKFRVQMRIREDLHTLIRVDSVASIQNDGLVGNKFVQVDAGTDQAQIVPPKGTMQSLEPFDLAAMLQRMTDTIELVTTTITEVKTGVQEALTALTATAKDGQLLMIDLGKDAREIMASTQKVAQNINAVVVGVRDGKGTVGRLVTDDALYVSAKNIAATVEKTMVNLRQASEQAKEAVAEFRGDGGPMKGITGNLQQTLASAKDVMADMAENSEALKRNFFFKGFFNKRGYFDLDDVSVQQYRQGALETADRRVLRMWLKGGLLFEQDVNGRVRLSDDGRTRLDSAMAQFVRYPRTSPFVVEGYGTGTTADERFLLSRSRAELVRNYLVGKFSLDPAVVAIMPMGREAAESPSGDEWDGVALALFVPVTALAAR